MGGKALHIATKRLEVDEFLLIEKEVVEKLLSKYPMAKPTKYFSNKKDFGDLDVIIVGEPIVYEAEKAEMTQYIKETFDTKDIFFNTGVVSFEYKDFQIDLILVKESELETAHFYFSYNDLNNLVGTFARQLGLSLGFDGLSIFLSDYTNNEHSKLVISREPRKIYEFLDLNFERYLEGFNSIEDVFKYVISSRYFTTSIFKYENLDSKNRTRNKKRKTYSIFLSWLDENKINKKFRWRKDVSFYHNSIEDFFKINIGIEVEKLNTKVAFRKTLAQKFNGDLIKKLVPGLEGIRLGKFMTEFKSTKDNFAQWVEDSDTENIENEILKFKEKMVS